MHQQKTTFENIVRKGKIARKVQFLLFPLCFLLNQIIESPFVHISEEEPKIGISMGECNIKYTCICKV